MAEKTMRMLGEDVPERIGRALLAAEGEVAELREGLVEARQQAKRAETALSRIQAWASWRKQESPMQLLVLIHGEASAALAADTPPAEAGEEEGS